MRVPIWLDLIKLFMLQIYLSAPGADRSEATAEAHRTAGSVRVLLALPHHSA
jgi:hypothetical protein